MGDPECLFKTFDYSGIRYGDYRWEAFIMSCHFIKNKGQENLNERINQRRKVYDCSNNPFYADFGSLDFNLPLIPIDDSSWPKNPGTPLILFHMTFRFSIETMLVHWPPLPITHNFLKKILMTLTIYMDWFQTTLYTRVLVNVTKWMKKHPFYGISFYINIRLKKHPTTPRTLSKMQWDG